MANLPAGRRSEPADLSHRVLREVIVQQKTAFDFAFLEIVHELLVFFGAQRRSHHCLGFASGKQSRSVRSW
jgi:hypothetical protein